MKSVLKRFFNKVIPEKLKPSIRQFIKSRKHDAYEGGQVICPICNSQHAIFAPFGTPERSNAKCLNCGSLERHRLMWKYLKDRTSFFTEKKIRVLHFAPEKFFFQKFSRLPNVEYTAGDLFPEVYKYDDKKKILKIDITQIPFNENTFDVIICNHVLEHIPDDHKAMSELYRVMKNDGWGIFQVPIDYKRDKTYEDFSITTPEGRQEAFGQDDHVRWYGKDYKNRLQSVGFKVNEDHYVKSFTVEDIAKYGFMANELIYCCKKN